MGEETGSIAKAQGLEGLHSMPIEVGEVVVSRQPWVVSLKAVEGSNGEYGDGATRR